MEIGRARRKSSQYWSFNLANMVELAIDQRLAEIGGRLAIVGRQTRIRVGLAHGDLRQVTHIQTSQIDGAIVRTGVPSPDVQWRGEGVVTDVGCVVARAAGSLKRWNAAGDQATSGDVVVDAGDADDRNLQRVEEPFTVSDGLPSGMIIVITLLDLSPFAVKVEDVRRKLTIPWGYKSARLLKGWKQKVHAGVDRDEKGLDGERRRPAPRAICIEIASVAISNLRGEELHFEIYDLLLLLWGGPRPVPLRVPRGGVKRLVRQIAQ